MKIFVVGLRKQKNLFNWKPHILNSVSNGKFGNSEFHKNKSILNDKVIQEYQAFCKSVGIPFDYSFWHKKLQSNNEEKEITSSLLLKEWQKNLDKSQAQWELEQIELARKNSLQS
ncbi:hypothetical protein ACTG5S_05600 [Pasteurella multocida]